MTHGLSLAEALQPGHWPTLVLVTARVVGLMLVAPLWSMSGVPGQVRGAMIVVISFMLLPGVTEGRIPDQTVMLPLPLATELLVGLAIGLCGAVLMGGVAMAGELAALQMGLNLGPSFSPLAESSTAGVGELKSMLALAVYVALGGHLVLLMGVARSFQTIPPGGVIDLARGGQVLVALAGTVFSTALRIAAPLVVAMLLANAALALLNKAVPQLNAMAVAFPVTIGIGLLVLGAALPFTGAFLGRAVGALPVQIDQVLQALAPAAPAVR